MEEVCQENDTNATVPTRSSRVEAAASVISFENAKKNHGLREREAASQIGVPRSTLRDRLKRKLAINAPPAEVAFFESPEGLAVIHRTVLAAQLVITLFAPGGIRLVCLFLTLSGLSHFVASSYGAQQKAILALERNVALFGLLEFRRLCELMPHKKITVLEDETFHPQICLVAIEAASGFILLEVYSEKRDSKTWTEELKKSLGDLPVEIVQATSDEAVALRKHQQEDLEVNHSPDVFHVEQELSRGTTLAMERRVKKAQSDVDNAKESRERHLEIAKICEKPEGEDENYSYEKALKNAEDAQKEIERAEEKLKEKEKLQEEIKESIRGISECYHPFDLESGQTRSAEEVESDLKKQFKRIDEIAEEEDLSEKSYDKINKARRVLPLMVTTIAFFHKTIKIWVDELDLSFRVKRLLLERWIPGCYLQLAASRAGDAAQRKRLLQAAADLIPSGEEIASMFSHLCDEDLALLSLFVDQCAQLFQRSSSSVEGRNGHLSLFHHGHHHLTESKLRALTVIHNFMKVRIDRTTAAERFFCQKPRDLFEWLVERMDFPAKPWLSGKKKAA